MGDSGRPFVEATLTLVEQDDSFMPRSFDKAEMRQPNLRLRLFTPTLELLTATMELFAPTMHFLTPNAPFKAQLFVR
jgi:hypothetical protein